MPALAAVGRAGAEAGRGGGRDGGAAGDGRLASWARMGEAARAAGARAREGRATLGLCGVPDFPCSAHL